MTETSITGLLTELEQIDGQAADRDREVAPHRETAQAARTQAEQAEALASSAATQGGNAAIGTLNGYLRQLSTEVDAARKAAIEAVHRGESVIDKWCQYRLAAARARGRWAALNGEYERLTGRQAPGGPYRPELREEGWDRFFRSLIIKAESDAFQQAKQEAHDEVIARRDRQAN